MKPLSALTIAGSDSSGGAGIQADLKTFMALQIHGCSAVTCITAQNTSGVTRLDQLPPISIEAQIQAVFSDIKISAIKTGMLLNSTNIEVTASSLSKTKIPKIIDPVMVSRAGSVLLETKAVEAYKSLLFPQADLLTPNIHEASVLTGKEINLPKDVEDAAKILIDQGAKSVLIKGGGLVNSKGSDYFLTSSEEGEWIRSQFIETIHTHGSGCTLGAAITAYRAKGISLKESIRKAKNFLQELLTKPLIIGSGPNPLCHWDTSPDLKVRGNELLE